MSGGVLGRVRVPDIMLDIGSDTELSFSGKEASETLARGMR